MLVLLRIAFYLVDALFKCGQVPGASATTSKWRPLNGRGSKRRRMLSQPPIIRIHRCSQILHCGSQTRPRPSLRHLLWRQVSQSLANCVLSGSLLADSHDQAIPPSVFQLTLRPKVATATPNSTSHCSQPLPSITTAQRCVFFTFSFHDYATFSHYSKCLCWRRFYSQVGVSSFPCRPRPSLAGTS